MCIYCIYYIHISPPPLTHSSLFVFVTEEEDDTGEEPREKTEQVRGKEERKGMM